MAIIIVEGIDRVGKTTLCNMISEKFDIPIFKEAHVFIPEDKQMYANFGSCRTLLNLVDCYKDINILLDRFHLSERVYGLLDRYYDCKKYYDIVENKLEKMENVYLIHVNPVDIKKSNKEHGKDLTRHYELFKMLYADSKLKKCQCNYLTLHVALEWLEKELCK